MEISAYDNSGQSLKDFQLTTDVKSKSDIEYGKRVAQTIYSTIYGNQSYFWIRNNRFRKNRQIANGKIDMSVFMDRLEMNSKQNYVNINWKSILIGNTIVSRLVGAWMKRREKVSVTAVDPTSAKVKKYSADGLEYFYENKDVIRELESQSGIPILPKDQFLPEDKEELDLWVSEFNRLPEEIKYSIGCNNILKLMDGLMYSKTEFYTILPKLVLFVLILGWMIMEKFTFNGFVQKMLFIPILISLISGILLIGGIYLLLRLVSFVLSMVKNLVEYLPKKKYLR